MGSNTSKSNTDIAVVEKNNLNGCSNADPRSPTPEISRTPLQDKTGGKHNITKNVDLRKTFEMAQGSDKFIYNNPILSAVINNHLQSYDPRSPTQDFERTPIIITSKNDDYDNETITKYQNDNCASPILENSIEDSDYYLETKKSNCKLMLPLNLCNELFDITLNDTIKENEEPMCSSTASTDKIEDNLSNSNMQNNEPTQLLETNFDYTEDQNDKFEEDSDESIHTNGSLEKFEDSIKCIPLFKILQKDPRSPSSGIERTPIVVPKAVVNTNDNNVEDMPDDILIKVLENKNADTCPIVTKTQEKYEEGLLIYEDDCAAFNDTPKKCKSITTIGSRTPLSCMKNKADIGQTRAKSANLYNRKTEKVIPKKVSHIPRLKSLSRRTNMPLNGSSTSLKTITKNAGIINECENTPPQSKCDLWDKNNSIIL